MPARIRPSFRLLFASLLAVSFLYGALDLGRAWEQLDAVLITAVLAAGAATLVGTGTSTLRAVGLVAPILALVWAEEAAGGLVLLTARHLLVAAFEVALVARLLGTAARAERVDADVVYGTTSVYLLLGLVFTHVYMVVSAVRPGSITVEPGADPLTAFSYFSFATLATMGPADMRPVSALARALTVLEAVTGNLFLAVVIARVVSTYVSHRERAGG